MKQRNKEDFLRNKHEQQLMLLSQETNQQYKTDLKKYSSTYILKVKRWKPVRVTDIVQ